MFSRSLFAGRILTAFLIFAGAGLCQRTTATIYGTVQDSSGAVIQAAAVIFTNEQTNASLTLASNDLGEFSASFIPVGRYSVKVEAKGFTTHVQQGVELTAGQQIRYPVTLQPGGVTEITTVTAEAPLLQDASATMNDKISRMELTELPLPRRDFSSLLTLQNGVRADGGGLFSINGLGKAGMSVTVDGVDASRDPETKSIANFGGQSQINVISLEGIQEVNVTKGVMPAEVGGTFSANFNIITRGGTNQFHGSLFENWQNDVLNARYVFSKTVPVVRFNQFGGSVGGPVKKDKLFFFFAYEGYRQSNQATVSGQVPTPEFKAQAINVLPAYKPYFDYWPNPTSPYAAGSASGLFQGTTANAAHDNEMVARADYLINSNNWIVFRWTHGRPFAISPTVPAAASNQFIYASDASVVTWTRSSARWTSEARFGFNNNDSNRLADTFTSNVPGIQLQGAWSMNGESLILNGHSYTMEDVIARSLGRHTLKFGGLYSAATPGRYDVETPVFRYGSPADVLANNPNRVQFTFGTPRYYGRTWNIGMFVQDDFRVNKNLTLNLGVRYEYYSVFKDKDGLIYNPGTIANAVSVPPVYRPHDSLYNADRNNIMPRVGFAWTPGNDSKTVIRGGGAVSVAPQGLRNFSEMAFFSPTTPFRFRFTGSDITNLKLKYPMNNTQGQAALNGKVVPYGVQTFDPNNPNPYVVQWTLTVQRQLTSSLVLETGYVGNKALKMQMYHNINLPGRLTNIAPYPQALSFFDVTPTDMSYYHAWQTSLRKRLSHDLVFNVNFTWSKVMAIANGDFFNGDNIRVQDESNLRADKGLTGDDRSTELRFDAVYTLPVDRWLQGHKTASSLIGGWQIGGILSASSGGPLTIVQSSAFENSRPDYAGGDPYGHPSTIDGLYLNKAAFALVPVSSVSGDTIRPGNVGKAGLRGPGYWNVDLNLGKAFRIKEKYSLQVRADLFNSLNHVNWGNPNTDVANSLFGRVTTARNARSMQLASRFRF